MHNYLILGLLTLTFACRSGSSDQSTKETAGTQPATESTTPDTLCFQQVISRDTTTLHLMINGNQATGYLESRPYEKDQARGPFEGTVSNTQIQANWQRSGEGTTQPYAMELTLKGDSISWLEGERIEKQGKWILKDPKVGYRYALKKIDCSTTSLR